MIINNADDIDNNNYLLGSFVPSYKDRKRVKAVEFHKF